MVSVADESVKDAISVSEIREDLEIFEDRMIETDALSVYDVNEDGHIVYEYLFDEDTVSYVDAWTDAEGDTCLRFEEDGLVNTLCFKEDGSMYLDGSKVEVEVTSGILMENNAVTAEENEIVPMAGMYSTFTTSVIPGTNFVDYSKSAMVLYDSTALRKLNKKIVKIGVSTLTTMVLNAWAPLVSKVGQTICTKVVKNGVGILIDTAPDATALDFKDYRRAHPSNDTLRMMFRHDMHSTPNTGNGSVTHYYEDRCAT